MTPGARVQAAIECLDEIFDGAAAEKTLTRWARRSRFAGSKDRAAVRDHVFDALRNRDSCASIGGALSGRAVMIGLLFVQDHRLDDLFTGVGHAPAELSDEEQARLRGVDSDLRAKSLDMPAIWFRRLEDAFPENALKIAQAMRARACVDLRVNLRKADLSSALSMLAEVGISAEPCEVSTTALRIIDGGRKVKNAPAYLEGFVELQDAGSQALVEMLPLKDGMKILDYCAGGGGKTLAMAGATNAQFFAHDRDADRMKDIPSRAKRAGVSVKRLSEADLGQYGPFDLVLCDAPCSGSGAWRRSPDAKWRLTEGQFDETLKVQREILSKAQRLVQRGGFLAYATCSLFSEENEDQVNAFLKDAPDFHKITQKSWTLLDDCDGFHISVLQRRAGQNNRR